jgi:hypothetical protein
MEADTWEIEREERRSRIYGKMEDELEEEKQQRELSKLKKRKK